MKHLVVLLLAVVLAAPAFAQKKASVRAHWSKEPTSIFGLKLGQRVSPDDLRECSPDPNAPPSPIAFCRTASKIDDATPVCCFAGIYELGGGMLFTEDGIARSLLITGRHSDYQAIRDLLIARYGSPTRRDMNEVTTRAGAKFRSEELTWTGKVIELSLQERAGEVDQSVIHFTHLPTMAKRLEQDRQRTAERAGKM